MFINRLVILKPSAYQQPSHVGPAPQAKFLSKLAAGRGGLVPGNDAGCYLLYPRGYSS